MERIDHNNISISTRKKITLQDSHCALIDGIQFYSVWAQQKKNSFKSNLAQSSNKQGTIMYCFAFSCVTSRH